MRIAIFHNLSAGGAKRALYSQVRFLAERKIHMDLYVLSTADESYLPLQDIVQGFSCREVHPTLGGWIRSVATYLQPALPHHVKLSDLERTHRDIAHEIDSRGYDLVLVEQDRMTMAPFLLRFLKSRHIYICQQPRRSDEQHLRDFQSSVVARWKRPFVEKHERILEQIDRDNAREAQHIAANSYFSREAIMRKYGRNAFVSYLGVDTRIFRPLCCPRRDFVISVGSLSPAKGYDFLIRSLAHVASDIRPRLVIAGQPGHPDLRSGLEALAAVQNVDLEFRVAVSDEELCRLYNEARLCLFAPYLEPFGLVPLEAMACGTPVIAVKEGGPRETIVDDKNGLLVERDEDSFATAISRILNDRELHDRLAGAGRASVEKFWTEKAAGQRFLEHINRIVHKETATESLLTEASE